MTSHREIRACRALQSFAADCVMVLALLGLLVMTQRLDAMDQEAQEQRAARQASSMSIDASLATWARSQHEITR